MAECGEGKRKKFGEVSSASLLMSRKVSKVKPLPDPADPNSLTAHDLILSVINTFPSSSLSLSFCHLPRRGTMAPRNRSPRPKKPRIEKTAVQKTVDKLAEINLTFSPLPPDFKYDLIAPLKHGIGLLELPKRKRNTTINICRMRQMK